MKECYYCGKIATSKEHIPPKCLFPDHIPGKDYRKNLITVKSCFEHNLEKSSDDEYLLFILTFNTKANEIPVKHLSKKISRAINNPRKSFRSFLRKPKRILYRDSKSGLIVPTYTYEIDVERYEKILKQIAIGLYYYKYKNIFNGEIQVIVNGALSGVSEKINQRQMEISSTFDSVFSVIKYKGENKEIFKYKIIKNNNIIFLKYVFYEKMEIVIKMIAIDQETNINIV